jgi:putative membrane protein
MTTMNTTISRYGGMALALAVCTTLGACNKRNNGYASNADTTTTGAAATTPAPLDTTAAGGAVANDTSKGAWTDADIVAWLAAANNGEISEGKLAERKATNPAVKAFARRMVTDHTQMLKEGNALAKKLNIDPMASTNGDVKDLLKDNQDAVQDLTQKQAGKDFDEDYMEKQVDGHQTVVDKLNDLSGKTQNADLKALMQKALPKVQAHLNSAKDIKDNRLQS